MISKIAKMNGKSLDIVVIAGAAQLLDKFTRSLLEREDIICLSQITELPKWVKAPVIYKSLNIKHLLNYILTFRKLLNYLKTLSRVRVYTPHLYHFESNILKNNFNADIVILPDGILDYYTRTVQSYYLTKAVFKKFISHCIGYKYIIYRSDIRGGLKAISHLNIELKIDNHKGSNIMILGPLMGSNVNNMLGIRNNLNNILLTKYEIFCSRYPNAKLFYKTHPTIHDNFKVWPGKLKVTILGDSDQAELLIDKYNIGIVIGNLSTALINVKTIFGENICAIDFGYNIFIKSNYDKRELIEIFTNCGVDIL
jgi:hypothetical protein